MEVKLRDTGVTILSRYSALRGGIVVASPPGAEKEDSMERLPASPPNVESHLDRTSALHY